MIQKVDRSYRLLEESQDDGILRKPLTSSLRREFESETHAAEAVKDFAPVGSTYIVVTVYRKVMAA